MIMPPELLWRLNFFPSFQPHLVVFLSGWSLRWRLFSLTVSKVKNILSCSIWRTRFQINTAKRRKSLLKCVRLFVMWNKWKLQPVWFNRWSPQPEMEKTFKKSFSKSAGPRWLWPAEWISELCADLQSLHKSSYRYPSYPPRPLTVQNEKAWGGRSDKSPHNHLFWSCCSIHHAFCVPKERQRDVWYFRRSCSFWDVTEWSESNTKNMSWIR